MPCIVCKKERWSILRIPLEVYSEAREHYFRENYFTNHEFDHVCRFCSIQEGVVGTFINTLGFVLNLAMRGWLVALGVLLAFGACLKFGVQGHAANAAPILAGLAVGGVVGLRFARWLFFGVGALAAFAAVAVFLMHSDTLSIMPDVKAMAQREQMRAGSSVQWSDKDYKEQLRLQNQEAVARGEPTTDVLDPIAASERRTAAARSRRLQNFANGIVAVAPFRLDLDDKEFRRYAELSGVTLGLYLVLVTLGSWMLGGIAREEAEKRRKKKQARYNGPGR